MTELELMQDIGRNIESVLEESNMSQRDLAREIGIDESTVSRYIRGKAMPTLKNLVNIAHVLVCDIGELAFSDEFIE